MLYDPKWEVQPEDKIGMVFQRAAEKIRLNGWCQEEFMDVHGHYCLVGALRAVTAEEDSVVCGIMKRLGFRTCRAAIMWNDHPMRTRAEVIWLLESAAAKK
jgi:hypothetical protein